MFVINLTHLGEGTFTDIMLFVSDKFQWRTAHFTSL